MFSAIVITKDEADRLRACLESIKWVDEIIVVDNGSKDNTLEIAKEYTGKVFEINSQDFAEIRNFAMKKAVGEWVLYIDADERVLESLKNEIESLVGLPDFSAYALSRKNIIFGQEVKYGPFWQDWVIRLLKRSDFEEWIGKVHEQPKFRGKLGYSKNSLLHLTHRNLDQIISKSLEWSKIDAKLRFDAGHPKMSGWRFLRIFVTEVFNQGVRRKGFFNGSVGIMDCLLQVFSLYMTYVRLWELQQARPREEVYKEIDKSLIENKFRS